MLLKFFEHLAELLKQALEYLELDTGYGPHEIDSVLLEISPIGQCILWFPNIGVKYFASHWSNGLSDADWQFNS